MNNEEKILAMLEQMDARIDKMDTRMDQMQEDISGIKVRLDYDVDVRLKAMSEGQEVIEKRLDSIDGELHDVKELAEKTADKVDVIHAVVTQHSAAITELKKVQ